MKGQGAGFRHGAVLVGAVISPIVLYTLLALVGAQSWSRYALSAAYLAAPSIALVLVVRVAKTTTGIEKRAWQFLAISLAAFALGDVAWTVEHFRDTPLLFGSVALSDGMYFVGLIPLLLFVRTTLASALQGAPVLTKTRYALDILIAMSLLGTVAFVAVAMPVFRAIGPDGSVMQWAVRTTLDMLGLFALTALLANILESREWLWHRWEAKIALGVGFATTAGLAGNALESIGRYQLGTVGGTVTDLLWMAGYAFFATAAIQRLQVRIEHFEMPVMAHARRGRIRWYDLGVSGALLSVVPYLLWESRYGGLSDVEFWVLGSSAFLIALLVLVRSVVLTSENGSLLFLTVVDPLTGTYNHRFFQERMRTEIDRARRSGEPLSLLLLDIDDFGRVNEQFGHSRGDRYLTSVAAVLRSYERSTDVLCRLGSDEFALIMPSTPSADAVMRSREIQDALAVDREVSEGIGSVSIGIASYPEHASDRAELTAKADGALYWAQVTGVGNVVVYDEQVVEALSPEERIHLAEEQSYMQTVESLAAAVDARDRYTQNHSRNVASNAAKLAEHMGLSENRVRLVRIAGLLHDVGKIGVPDSILRKPGALTDEEYETIREHPELGERILSATIFTEILPWVLSHHERWDGEGYPNGIAGEEIPLEARILAVCDSYDAMISDRPYRVGMDPALAIRELRHNSGSQFDAGVVRAFIDLLEADDAFLPQAERASRLPQRLGSA